MPVPVPCVWRKAVDNLETSNPMTEIALALAMGFFCLMVLALLSMGQPESSDKEKQEADALDVVAMVFQPVTDVKAEAVVTVNQEDLFLVHYGGVLMDQFMKPVKHLNGSKQRIT